MAEVEVGKRPLRGVHVVRPACLRKIRFSARRIARMFRTQTQLDPRPCQQGIGPDSLVQLGCGSVLAPGLFEKRGPSRVVLRAPRRERDRLPDRRFRVQPEQIVRPGQAHRPVNARPERGQAGNPCETPERIAKWHGDGRRRLTIKRAKRYSRNVFPFFSEVPIV